jgi:hypothetical protein
LNTWGQLFKTSYACGKQQGISSSAATFTFTFCQIQMSDQLGYLDEINKYLGKHTGAHMFKDFLADSLD